MATPTPSDDDTRRILHNVLRQWRADQIKAIRNRIRDIEDRIEDLTHHGIEPDSQEARMAAQLREQVAQLSERKNAKLTMIEEAYQLMLEFVNRTPSPVP
jgi:cob(I)alamin adenosyltransferase